MSVTDRKDLRHLGWGPGGGPSARPARLGTLGGMPAVVPAVWWAQRYGLECIHWESP